MHRGVAEIVTAAVHEQEHLVEGRGDTKPIGVGTAGDMVAGRLQVGVGHQQGGVVEVGPERFPGGKAMTGHEDVQALADLVLVERLPGQFAEGIVDDLEGGFLLAGPFGRRVVRAEDAGHLVGFAFFLNPVTEIARVVLRPLQWPKHRVVGDPDDDRVCGHG